VLGSGTNWYGSGYRSLDPYLWGTEQELYGSRKDFLTMEYGEYTNKLLLNTFPRTSTAFAWCSSHPGSYRYGSVKFTSFSESDDIFTWKTKIIYKCVFENRSNIWIINTEATYEIFQFFTKQCISGIFMLWNQSYSTKLYIIFLHQSHIRHQIQNGYRSAYYRQSSMYR
jgi:hypothetical protein